MATANWFCRSVPRWGMHWAEKRNKRPELRRAKPDSIGCVECSMKCFVLAFSWIKIRINVVQTSICMLDNLSTYRNALLWHFYFLAHTVLLASRRTPWRGGSFTYACMHLCIREPKSRVPYVHVHRLPCTISCCALLLRFVVVFPHCFSLTFSLREWKWKT